ncbi:MAG: tetratricopeptide repeat protein [Thermoguttaceae bacterium]
MLSFTIKRASRIVKSSLAICAVVGLFSLDSPNSYSQTSVPRTNASAQNGNAQNTSARAAQSAGRNAPQRPVAAPQTQAIPQANDADRDADSVRLTAEEETLYKDALVLFNQQNFAGSLEKLRELYASNPASRPPRLIVARWFAQLNNPQAVRLSLEQATTETPDDPEAYYSLAEIAIREGSFTAAELLTQRGDLALAKYNANPTRQRNLTRASNLVKLAYSNARQKWNDSLRAITELIRLDGETAELDRAYARVLFQLNEDEKARQALQRAEKLDADGLPADAAMAQLYAMRGDKENAKASLDAALSANPKSTKVLLLSISNALGENDLNSAWNLVRRLYQEEKSAEVLKTYGKVALFRSDFRNAEIAFQEAVRQNPLDTDASGGLALALCEQGDEEKCKRALQYAASNVQKQSNNRDFLATLGWTLYKAGQVDEAVKVLQQSIADGQINAASAYYFAVILNEKGQDDVAKQLLTAALSTTPPFAKRTDAQKLLAQIEAQQSQPTRQQP